MKNYTTEIQEQINVVEYCDLYGIPIVHVPNESKRSITYGMQLKRAGMRRGFPDLYIPVPKGGYHGLFIEMKVGKNKPTEAQKYWLQKLRELGHRTDVCYGFDEAIKVIKNYMKEVG